MIKKISLFTVLIIWTATVLYSQNESGLSLTEAYQLLENRYPGLKNGSLSEEIFLKEIESINKEKKPSILVKADTRLQSHSVSLDAGEGVNLPFEIDQPIFSAKAYLEANYVILDGGRNRIKKKLKAVELAAEKQTTEVDRYALRERINSLFINIILLREQENLFKISLNDLDERRIVLNSAVENGIALESELTKLEVKKLELQSGQENIRYKLKGLKTTLEQLLNIQIPDDTALILPNFPEGKNIPNLNRPEQTLFQLKREAVNAQSDILEISKKPMLGAFAQAGVGYPNPLNLLDNSASPYGLVGAQFSWTITDWKKSAIDKEILSLQAQKLKIAEETFEFNMNSKKATYLAETERLNAQIDQDRKIADLQNKILKQLAFQLDEGVITANDYTTQVNEELRARQNLLIHEKELIKLKLEFMNERGVSQ